MIHPANADKLLEDLTEPQREAVRHVDGPLLIIAGAGSGKTRVITRRVGWLMSQGIPAASILAITFTNKAAGEMKSRVSQIVGHEMRDFGRLDQRWPTICTFHSLCLRILRYFAPTLGLPANFSIYDASDQTRLIKEALKLTEISSTNFPPAQAHATISNAKNQLVSAEDFASAATDFYNKQVARVYLKYQKLLTQNNALDFDDLLLRTAFAFRAHPALLQQLQERFQYILIDEYQDTNKAQYIIAHALALKHKNICVVGDPDQSIYAWRGADIRNILDFEKDYADAKVVRLEQNYRSTKTILHLASELIAHNTQRKDKTLWTENDQGDKAKLFLCQDEHDEALLVADQLRELHDKHGHSWNSMAIFYRINALSRVMEDALRRGNIPYQIARGVEFYNRKEIKDVLAYLRVVANPSDEVSLMRIINVPPRGIGDSSVKLMQTHAVANGLSLWDAMLQASQGVGATLAAATTAQRPSNNIPGLSTRALNATQQFVHLVQSWRKIVETQTTAGEKGRVQTIMEAIIQQSGLETLLKKIGEKEKDELANVEELVSSAAEYDADNPEGSLVDYLALVSLVSDADHLKNSGGAVTLMTLHAAKGLEFPIVAMIGLEEGILPHSRARDNNNELEEERRLCFVGITRAQQRLILTKANVRTVRGLRERTIASPFLAEMPASAIDVYDRNDLAFDSDRFARLRSEDWQGEQRREQKAAAFRRGQRVRHPTFGLGRIADISNMGQQTRAVVEFNTVGRKTLILEYARLEPVG